MPYSTGDPKLDAALEVLGAVNSSVEVENQQKPAEAQSMNPTSSRSEQPSNNVQAATNSDTDAEDIEQAWNILKIESAKQDVYNVIKFIPIHGVMETTTAHRVRIDRLLSLWDWMLLLQNEDTFN